MIKIFGQTDRIFSSNGDAVVGPLKAHVHKKDNGDFYLDLVVGLEWVDYIIEGNIVVANTPQGDQAFRVGNITKTKNKITAKCFHVFYDSRNYLIEDSNVIDKNCNDALAILNNATEPTSPFTTISNVEVVNSFKCVRKSLYEAIQAVIERWGGHLVRDNFTIAINTQIGQDNGVTVEYKKNLKDITCEEKWDNVVTKLLPVGKNGILLNALDETASVYVESLTQYSIPYTKTVSFTQDEIKEEDYTDADGNLNETAYKQALVRDLRVQAIDYVDKYSVPEVNYTLKANLEKITDIGDVVEVKDRRLGIQRLTNVIAYDYDCILNKYVEVQFGNFKNTLSGLVSNITTSVSQNVGEQVQTSIAGVESSIQQATAEIWDVMGNSYVVYDGDMIMIVDRLPKETATNVVLINNDGIAFSQTGINGTFTSAWAIDGTLNMQAINVINLVADMIKGGTLKLGSHENVNGVLELYDNENNLVGQMDKIGLQMYGIDGSYIVINNTVGFVCYDRNGNKTFWLSGEEFHTRKSVIEEVVILCNQFRFVPIQKIDGNNNVTNEGIGLVPVYTGGGN